MSEIIERARQLRVKIEELATNHIEDGVAADFKELFPAWDGNGKAYTAGDRVRFAGIIYKVLQDHTSQSNWTPDATPSLFTEVLIPDPSVIPEWKQPDSTNPYMKGDVVSHNGFTWESLIDNNVWEPTESLSTLWKKIS